MSEAYVELIVEKAKRPVDALIKGVAVGITVVAGLCGVLYAPFMLAVALVLGIGCYFLFPSLNIEYEYLYLDKEISIDKIFSKQRRKHAATFDLNKMELLAPEGSHQLDSYQNRNGVKVKDYSSGAAGAKRFVMVYQEETLSLVYLEPNEEMLKCIRNVFPRKVFVD